jgi:hypothetical protein
VKPERPSIYDIAIAFKSRAHTVICAVRGVYGYCGDAVYQQHKARQSAGKQYA